LSEVAKNLRFSQRNGTSPLPQQLSLGQLSQQFTALIWGAIYSDMQENTYENYHRIYFGSRWTAIIYDFNVEMMSNSDPQNIAYDVRAWISLFSEIIKDDNYSSVFDCLEYFFNHTRILPETKARIRSAFEKSHLAYRMLPDGMVVAIGTAEQADAVQNAFEISSNQSPGAASHLRAAAAALARSDWALSVRESITAVEAAARLVAGDSATLGEALKTIGKSGAISPMLKAAMEKLYAYTNSEGGIRHANVFEDKANVDEDDALFMLGACASFVTFLLAKNTR
jgi:hypothetical protein